MFSHAQIIGGAVVLVLAAIHGFVQGWRQETLKRKWWREGGWRFTPANE